MHVHRRTDGLLLPTLALGLVTIVALYNQRSCQRATDASQQQCDYSRQPYRFVTEGNGSDPRAWRLESRIAECPLRDLAGALANGSRPDGGTGQLIIFFQGDSVDRYLVGEFCSRAGARVSTWPVGNSTEFAAQMMVCNTSAVFMLFTWINGVHSQPPWALGGHSPQENLEEGLRVLAEVTGAATPHVLVLSANLWDLSYWLSDGGIPLSLDAPPSLGDRLVTYEDNLRQHVALVRRMLPATRFLALHTTVRYSATKIFDRSGKNRWQTQPHAIAYISQVNAVIRAVAAHEGLPVIDYEPLALQMPDQAGLFLKDGYHVQPAVQVNVMLNVLLNEYAARAAQPDGKNSACKHSVLRHLRTGCPVRRT